MWKQPPIPKIYEALGAVADGRIEIEGDCGKCYSSSGNKYYEVTYDPDANAIMANDNASYWNGYLGYPAIAFLLKKGVLEYLDEMGECMKGIAWKDINQKFKNDFDKALTFILDNLDTEKRSTLEAYVEKLWHDIAALKLKSLGKKALPPKGY